MKVRIGIGLVAATLGGSLAGCMCPCASPSPYSGAVYSAPAGGSSARPAREHSYYDRYLEDRHRREVEKDLRDIKRNHLAHHFHNEQGNFGITSSVWDRVLGTYYAQPKDVRRSPTAHNLGYTAEMAERYPWVAALSEDEETYARQRRRRTA